MVTCCEVGRIPFIVVLPNSVVPGAGPGAVIDNAVDCTVRIEESADEVKSAMSCPAVVCFCIVVENAATLGETSAEAELGTPVRRPLPSRLIKVVSRFVELDVGSVSTVAFWD